MNWLANGSNPDCQIVTTRAFYCSQRNLQYCRLQLSSQRQNILSASVSDEVDDDGATKPFTALSSLHEIHNPLNA